MAHLTERHLPEESEKFMKSLGFVLCRTCDSQHSVWSNLEFGSLYIPLKSSPPLTVIDVLKFAREQGFSGGYREAEKVIWGNLSSEFHDFLNKKIFKKEPEREITYA